jgi:hypothetical protein
MAHGTRMKYELELNITDDGTFLNYWDSGHGNDVVVEVVNGELFLSASPVAGRISLDKFIQMVKGNKNEL